MVEVGVKVTVGVQVCPRESTQDIITGVGVLGGAAGLFFPVQDKPIPDARISPADKPKIFFMVCLTFPLDP